MSQAELDYASSLLKEGRPLDAVSITERLVARPDASHGTLATHAHVLKVLNRPEAALAFNRLATERFPGSGVAWHNLAATLQDLGEGEEARAAIERGMSLGLDGAESWGVYARVLMTVGDHDAAERAYVEARRRAPADVRLTLEYANYVWMRRGDLSLGLASLDTVFHAGGPPGAALIAKAQLLKGAGQPVAARDLLLKAALALPRDVPVLLAAAHAAVEHGEIGEAERLARSAELLAPRDGAVLNQLTIVYLAAGRADVALKKARSGLEASPDDQSLLGWAAMAARACGDPLYKMLYDYAGLVAGYDIATPDGWRDTESFLVDLAATLKQLHRYERHPINQSIEGGVQTVQNLRGSGNPALQALFKAIDVPIRKHMKALGQGDDPHRRRNMGNYRIKGAWSVRLQPGGYHRDHFHPEGWISSAFYVETPDAALDRGAHEGWLRFGQPPILTSPPILADHFERPKAGRLVLFPSYMWHGTVPFGTNEPRMTVAFDIVPG